MNWFLAFPGSSQVPYELLALVFIPCSKTAMEIYIFFFESMNYLSGNEGCEYNDKIIIIINKRIQIIN